MTSSINPNLLSTGLLTTRKSYSVEEMVRGIREGNRTILSRAITLIESNLEEHNEFAQRVLEQLLPYSGRSLRIGITGIPGVGKSTFIESFGNLLIEKGHRVAVLAIDPSSQRTKGSILGDKTRMETLSKKEEAFIRPSPSSGSLGGVARKTRESMFLCEAFGFDVILVETVGVGQSETQVHSMVDFFLLLMIAGAGDELQGMKRGIMEMADMITINKADGDNEPYATRARAEYESALHLFPLKESKWSPKVLTCSSLNQIGLEAIWNTIQDYKEIVKTNGFFATNRSRQTELWFEETLKEAIQEQFFQIPGKRKAVEESKARIASAQSTILTEIKRILS